MGIPYVKERKKKNRTNSWNNNDWEFAWLNVRYQTTDPGNAENIKQEKKEK